MDMMHHPNMPQDAAPEAVVLCAEESARDVIGYWLTTLPARVVVAADGSSANRHLYNRHCRLLVTDRALPPWPGLNTFLELRSHNPGLRIAFIDNGSLDSWILARVTGATHLLPRPLSRKDLISVLGQPAPVA